MPIESATYISDLNASNPIGATDPLSSADDHLRLLKATIKATFPSVTGAVTPTHTELNNLAGVTGKTGTGNVVLSASPTLTGTLTAAAITASGAITAAASTITGNLFSGSGASLTNLPAANLTGGPLPALSGVNLTNLNASNLASGSVADARLGNAALKNTANDFSSSLNGTWRQTVTNTNNGAAALTLLEAVNSSGNAFQAFIRSSAGTPAHEVVVQANSAPMRVQALGANTLTLASNGVDAVSFNGGVVTTPNTSASEVGWKGSPLRAISAGDNTAATDAGKTVRFTGGSGQTFTLDGDPPTDSRITLINSSGNNWTIAASGTLSHPTIGTGSRTMNTGATLEAHHLGAGSWYIVSSGGTIT